MRLGVHDALDDAEQVECAARKPKIIIPDNGIVERWHRTLLDEHFRVEGRRTWFETLDEMQTVLDQYISTWSSTIPTELIRAAA